MQWKKSSLRLANGPLVLAISRRVTLPTEDPPPIEVSHLVETLLRFLPGPGLGLGPGGRLW